MRHTLYGMLMLVWCCGCARSPVQAPPTHPGLDLSKVNSVAGIVYRADATELVVYTSSAALRFKLSPTSSKLVYEGKHVADLSSGDSVEMKVHFAGGDQGMDIDSFSVKPRLPSSQPNPHHPHSHEVNPQPTKPPGSLPGEK